MVSSQWTLAYALPILLSLVGVSLTTPVDARALATRWELPDTAQEIDQKAFNNLDPIASQNVTDGSYLFIPPGSTAESLKAKPFHVYDDNFLTILGSNPTLTLIADSGTDPLFHEAAVWWPPTDEVFFVQNAGAKAAGTGLAKSAIIEKISLSQAAAAAAGGNANATGQVDVVTVPSSPQVINPNGGTNWNGGIVFCGEGQGPDVASALYYMNPVEPYNTTVLLNNFYGRQFNSLNDVAVHPNGWLYFTDVDYGVLQDFRAKVNIRRQVYRFRPDTGVVQAVTDHALRPNGITFSPDGKWMYIADTGAAEGFTGMDWSLPASIYRFPVNDDGTIGSATLFAYVSPGIPDGVHCDEAGNLYAGVGDGIHVWDPAGTLLGKIYVGATSANFASSWEATRPSTASTASTVTHLCESLADGQFAGKGRMVICAETELYYATFAAEGAHLPGLQGLEGAGF